MNEVQKQFELFCSKIKINKTYSDVVRKNVKAINKNDKIIIDYYFDQYGIIYLKIKGFDFPFVSVVPETPLTDDFKEQIFSNFKRRGK